MGSLSGFLQRPLAAIVAVVATVVSVDVPDKLHTKSAPICPNAVNSSPQIQVECSTPSSWFSYVSAASPTTLSPIKRFSSLSKASSADEKLLCNQFVATPLLHGSLAPSGSIETPNKTNLLTHTSLQKTFLRSSSFPLAQAPWGLHCIKHFPSTSAQLSIFLALYKSADLTYGLPNAFSCNSKFSSFQGPIKHSDISTTLPREFHVWHLPKQGANGSNDSLKGHSEQKKPIVAVVLLGWLGAKQKHLKRYADWYNSRGIHAITFTVPMKDIVSYKPGGKADQNLDLLVTELVHWMDERNKDSPEKYLIFHTFSNTGWLTYGVLLEKFLARDHSLVDNIKGCVVDSAPVAIPDPQVWASGFSAALLKKNSVATKGMLKGRASSGDLSEFENEPKTAVAETALLVMLEKFFKVFLKLPIVDRRLSDVLGLLSNQQPQCPQLYIYSTADRVIPAESVEAFIEKQKKAGHKVRACNFELSPHVDHFRNFPDLYTSQLSSFLEDCLHNDEVQ